MAASFGQLDTRHVYGRDDWSDPLFILDYLFLYLYVMHNYMYVYLLPLDGQSINVLLQRGPEHES